MPYQLSRAHHQNKSGSNTDWLLYIPIGLVLKDEVGLSSLEEDMIEQIRERLSSGELVPTFSDLLYVSIALEEAWQQSVRAIDRSEEVKPERRVVTQQDYEDTLTAARKRMKELKAVG